MTDVRRIYTLVVNRPGYLPEAEPTHLEIDTDRATVPQILEAIYAEVDQRADWEDDAPAWNVVLDEIEKDRDQAARFSETGGFLYRLPDGYVIEATVSTEYDLEEEREAAKRGGITRCALVPGGCDCVLHRAANGDSRAEVLAVGGDVDDPQEGPAALRRLFPL